MSLPLGVTAVCATIMTVGGAVATGAGIMYPMVSTFHSVTRLEKSKAEVKSQLDLMRSQQDLMKSQLDKIVLKLKIA